MRANVEMLELKSETVRSRIHQGIVLVDQLEDSMRTETPRARSSQAEQDRKLLEIRIDEKKLQIAEMARRILENPCRDRSAQLSDRPSRPIDRRIRKGLFRQDDRTISFAGSTDLKPKSIDSLIRSPGKRLAEGPARAMDISADSTALPGHEDFALATHFEVQRLAADSTAFPGHEDFALATHICSSTLGSGLDGTPRARKLALGTLLAFSLDAGLALRASTSCELSTSDLISRRGAKFSHQGSALDT